MAVSTRTFAAGIAMACRGRSASGGRCRHMVVGAGRCPQHRHTEAALAPHTVLWKAKLNHKKVAALRAVGIKLTLRTPAREQQLDKTHAKHAQDHRRKADAVRTKPDSGTPVFGGEGFVGILSVATLWQQMEDAGYTTTGFHLYQREQDKKKGMAILVVEFSLNGTPVEDLDSAFRRFAASYYSETPYGHSHIWANPPRSDNVIVHTVNLAHAKPGEKPTYELQFDNGHWGLADYVV